jgi:hypothetical protein
MVEEQNREISTVELRIDNLTGEVQKREKEIIRIQEPTVNVNKEKFTLLNQLDLMKAELKQEEAGKKLKEYHQKDRLRINHKGNKN